MQINDRIISLIARKCSGQASKEDLEQLQAWIDSGTGNREEYELFVGIWNEANPDTGDNSFDTTAAWLKVDPFAVHSLLRRKQSAYLLFLKRLTAAAFVIIIAGAGYYFWLKLHPSVRSVLAATNQVIQLPDGSTVSLRKGSSIEYSAVFNSAERLVQLDGEAFFQVVRNINQPFRVVTDRAEVKVTGTSFLVRSDDSTEEVVVATGKVDVRAKQNNDRTVLLKAGQKAVLTHDRFEQSVSTDSNYIAWKTGVLDFRNTSMLKVLEDLKHFYAVPIDAQSSNSTAIAAINITVHFENQPLAEVLNELTLITGLKVRKEKEKIIFFAE